MGGSVPQLASLIVIRGATVDTLCYSAKQLYTIFKMEA